MCAAAVNNTRTADQLKAIGGELCLDFINTVSGRGTEKARDYLTSYTALAAWSHQTAAIADETAVQVGEEAERHPDEAVRVLKRAIVLREALYRIFVAQTESRAPLQEDLTHLNVELSNAMANLRLGVNHAGYAWTWENNQALDQVLWPVARSAAELLTSREIDRVRQCANEQCNWLFVDRTRNHSRRWCDMKDCGNVAKVRRHRRRKEKQS